MPGLSHQKTVAYCELLHTTLKAYLEEMPHLSEEWTSLDGLLIELKGYSNEQEALKGRFREISRLRREAEQRSLELRSRIVAQLRGKLGFTNETLMAFGITPRSTTRRRRTTTKPPEETPSAGAQQTGEKEAPSSSSGS